MGSGSDFTAFQDFAGVSSVDLGFGSGPTDPVYHYHSNYDSSYWMDNFGDPGFKYHATAARIIALLAAKLVEEPIISFNATDYAFGLGRYLEDTKHTVAENELSSSMLEDIYGPLEKAIEAFEHASVNFDYEAARLGALLGSKLHSHVTSELYRSVHSTNTKYKLLERQFLYAPGLDSREWFKHVVFAPGLWTGYAGATYPGLTEAIDLKNETAIRKWVDIIETAVHKATELLSPQ